MNKRLVALAAAVALALGITAAHAQQLPAKFADDPVAQAVGPEIFSAAFKEGTVAWYDPNAGTSDSTIEAILQGNGAVFGIR